MNAGCELPTYLAGLRRRILRVIEEAAPPLDRSDGTLFVPTGGGDEAKLERQIEAWRNAVAGDDQGRFEDYLRRRGLTAEAFQHGLRRAALRDPAKMPTWGTALLDLMQGAAAAELNSRDVAGPARSPSDPWQPAFAPFLDTAMVWLRTLIAPLPIEVTAAAYEGMVAVLSGRLRSCAAPLLQYEFRLAAALPNPLTGWRAPNPGTGQSHVVEWLGRFESFPGLAYVMAISYRNWQGYIETVCTRLAADLGILSEALFGGEAPGRLCNFDGDLGDLHNHGQSVAILTFENGRKAVYKPKDLRIAAAYMALISFLNRHGLDPNLTERTVLLRLGYAWEEFLPHRPCASIDQIERFYVRMGMTIRLLQLLEGRDFWLDNLIACGEHPVFIDLEMLLQPRVPATGLLPAELEIRNRLAESVVETCAITMLTPIDIGIPAEDLGALATPKPYLAPFRRDLTAGNTKKRPPRVEDFVTWIHIDHAPVLNGRPVDAAGYLDEILLGYRKMQNVLAANTAELCSDDGPLAAFRDAPLRFIYRDTWSCQKLIQRSVMPASLADAISREVSLHRLLQGAGDQQMAQSDQYRRIIDSEIVALRELDVPFFTCRPDSSAVLTQEGTTIENYFDGTAWDRLRGRVRSLPSFPIGEQCDILRSCFATGRRSVSPLPSPGGCESTPSQSCLDEALAIGEMVLRDAAVGSDGSLAWLGFVYRPHIDQLSLEPLQADLLTGSCGVAVFFSDLFHVTRQHRWREAAVGALSSSRKALAEAPENWSALRAGGHRSVPLYSGAFCGTGAHIFALSYCARALDAADLIGPVEGLLPQLPIDLLLDQAPGDVVTGCTGLLLAIVAAAEAGASDSAVAMAQELASRLATRSDPSQTAETSYPPEAALIGSLPGMQSGMATVLARLDRLDGGFGGGFGGGKAAKALDTFERDLNAGEQCTSGDLIIVLEGAGRGQRDLGQLTDRADRFLAELSVSAETARLLDAVDVALAAFAASESVHYQQRAAELAKALQKRRAAYGSWFPCSVAADQHNLSVIAGLPAIGRALLRSSGLLHGASIRALVPPALGQCRWK